MSKSQIAGDIIFLEIKRIERHIEDVLDEIEIINKKISELNKKKKQLYNKVETRRDLIQNVKKQGGELKRFVWASDDPNIIEMRNDILVAAKLIKEPAKS